MKSKKKKSRDKYSKVKDRWVKACNKWLEILWRSDFYVTYEFGTVGSSDDEGWIAIANVTTKPRYKDTLITADPKQLYELTPELLDKHACHEIMHIVLSQYQDFTKDLIDWIPGQGKREVFRAVQKDEVELLATNLTQIVIKLYKNSKLGSCCHKHDPKQKLPVAKEL
ncbi:hypothetical protein LCGC14_1106180 [marine sediment metagenome]|uniref:SprT-like domain-containing protein n=1 Tax=marine sediment metagenome TaxID=412755 RepID=A0A0F9MVZ1_9ZZZZ